MHKRRDLIDGRRLFTLVRIFKRLDGVDGSHDGLWFCVNRIGLVEKVGGWRFFVIKNLFQTVERDGVFQEERQMVICRRRYRRQSAMPSKGR